MVKVKRRFTLFQERTHGRMHSSMPSPICLLEKTLLPKFYVFFVQRQTSNTDINVPFYVEKDEVILLKRNIMRKHATSYIFQTQCLITGSQGPEQERNIPLYIYLCICWIKSIILGKPDETAVNFTKAWVKSACALKSSMKRTKRSGWNCGREIISRKLRSSV